MWKSEGCHEGIYLTLRVVMRAHICHPGLMERHKSNHEGYHEGIYVEVGVEVRVDGGACMYL
jgi:hypothetical protein